MIDLLTQLRQDDLQFYQVADLATDLKLLKVVDNYLELLLQASSLRLTLHHANHQRCQIKVLGHDIQQMVIFHLPNQAPVTLYGTNFDLLSYSLSEFYYWLLVELAQLTNLTSLEIGPILDAIVTAYPYYLFQHLPASLTTLTLHNWTSTATPLTIKHLRLNYMTFLPTDSLQNYQQLESLTIEVFKFRDFASFHYFVEQLNSLPTLQCLTIKLVKEPFMIYPTYVRAKDLRTLQIDEEIIQQSHDYSYCDLYVQAYLQQELYLYNPLIKAAQ